MLDAICEPERAGVAVGEGDSVPVPLRLPVSDRDAVLVGLLEAVGDDEGHSCAWAVKSTASQIAADTALKLNVAFRGMPHVCDSYHHKQLSAASLTSPLDTSIVCNAWFAEYHAPLTS